MSEVIDRPEDQIVIVSRTRTGDRDIDRARAACAASVNGAREQIARSRTVSQMLEATDDAIPVDVIEENDSLVIHVENMLAESTELTKSQRIALVAHVPEDR